MSVSLPLHNSIQAIFYHRGVGQCKHRTCEDITEKQTIKSNVLFRILIQLVISSVIVVLFLFPVGNVLVIAL